MKKYLKRGVKYSLHPHELGLCGPQGVGKGKLYQYLTTDKVSDAQLKKVLREFIALAPYLKLIAESNKIADWFDRRVFDAYWIGNSLLENVSSKDLADLVRSFANQGRMTAVAAEKIALRVHKRHRPHHSFHVFVVGSITGRVERGTIGQELCRIGWGKVKLIRGDTLVIRAKTLVKFRGKYLPKLGKEKLIEIKRDPLILPRAKAGDMVSYHWGRAVEIIPRETARRLEYWTNRTLKYL